MLKVRREFRKWLRSSRFLTWLIECLLAFKLSKKLILKLGIIYLQSDGYKKDIHKVLKKTISVVQVGEKLANITLSKSAVIKAPSLNEKGVIIVGFEHELERIVNSENFHLICDQYNILFMPTWQPFYSVELLKFLKLRPDAITILPSSVNCYFQSINVSPLINVLPFHASSWIDETIYEPLEKDIDILMVANFSTYKRHNLLFEALRELPKSLKVLLVGRPLKDRTSKDLLNEADIYGVRNRFELVEAPSDNEVRNYLCRAKLVLGLSGREGSYVSLAEALFADAAVAVFSDAYIGTKSYITPQSGFLLQPERSLAEQIATCLELSSTLSPREWAVKNISAKLNNQKLNKLLKHSAVSKNELWSRDCCYFRIQSFQFEPLLGEWPNDIKDAVSNCADKGIIFKTQV